MKKILLYLFLIFITLCSYGCTRDNSDAVKFKKEYESLNNKKNSHGEINRKISINKHNSIKYSDASEIVEMMENNKTFIVYFGFSECPWCRSVVPTLLDVANDLEINTIYYVDILNIRDEITVGANNEMKTTKKGTKSYYKLLKLLDNVLDDYSIESKNGDKIDTFEKRIYAPNVISVVDGKAMKLETGISKKQTDPYMKLSKEMKKETYNKFKCSLKCLLENKNVCTENSAC
ncbi:MAG: hypothetical protein IJF92_05015 [Bacilli bacterium]|nr:hypothetical protein [Bacilli bacterium]